MQATMQGSDLGALLREIYRLEQHLKKAQGCGNQFLCRSLSVQLGVMRSEVRARGGQVPRSLQEMDMEKRQRQLEHEEAKALRRQQRRERRQERHDRRKGIKKTPVAPTMEELNAEGEDGLAQVDKITSRVTQMIIQAQVERGKPLHSPIEVPVAEPAPPPMTAYAARMETPNYFNTDRRVGECWGAKTPSTRQRQRSRASQRPETGQQGPLGNRGGRDTQRAATMTPHAALNATTPGTSFPEIDNATRKHQPRSVFPNPVLSGTASGRPGGDQAWHSHHMAEIYGPPTTPGGLPTTPGASMLISAAQPSAAQSDNVQLVAHTNPHVNKTTTLSPHNTGELAQVSAEGLHSVKKQSTGLAPRMTYTPVPTANGQLVSDLVSLSLGRHKRKPKPVATQALPLL